MATGFLSVILIIILAVIFIVGLSIGDSQREKSKKQLIAIVEQSGGENVIVEYRRQFGKKGVIYFDVNYIDLNGEKQTRTATQHYNLAGVLSEEFYWNKPLQISESSTKNTTPTTKE